MSDHDQEIVAVRLRTTLLQDKLREAIQRMALESRSPGGTEAEAEHECLVAVRNSLDDLESTVADLSSKDSAEDAVALLQVLERTRHEVFALASRGLRHAEREKAVLQEVVEFVDIPDAGAEAGGGSVPPASAYDPIFSTPPQAADRIVGPKRGRLSPTSVLFDLDASPGGAGGMGDEGDRDAAGYFDRSDSSPYKKGGPLFIDDRRALGAPGPADAAGGMGVEQERRGGVLLGIGRLVRLGFFVGGVAYLLSRLQPRGLRRLGRDVLEVARDHPLVVRAEAFLRKHAKGQPKRQHSTAPKAAARRPFYGTLPPAIPEEDMPSAYVARERSSRPSADGKAPAAAPATAPPVFERDAAGAGVGLGVGSAPDIFFGQG